MPNPDRLCGHQFSWQKFSSVDKLRRPKRLAIVRPTDATLTMPTKVHGYAEPDGHQFSRTNFADQTSNGHGNSCRCFRLSDAHPYPRQSSEAEDG